MRLLDLPFRERPVAPLLGFVDGRAALDVSYAGYGWACPARVRLDDGRHPRIVEAPLLLALHSADDAPAQTSDVLLEFALDERPDAPTVSASLAGFLAAWLPRLPAARPIVLALCNPHGATLPAPAAAGDRQLYYALGDVDAWLDDDDPTPRLHASAWRTTLPEAS